MSFVDDFFTAGAPASQEYSNNLSTMLSLCQKLNAPVNKPLKIEGPTTPGHTNSTSVAITDTHAKVP